MNEKSLMQLELQLICHKLSNDYTEELLSQLMTKNGNDLDISFILFYVSFNINNPPTKAELKDWIPNFIDAVIKASKYEYTLEEIQIFKDYLLYTNIVHNNAWTQQDIDEILNAVNIGINPFEPNTSAWYFYEQLRLTVLWGCSYNNNFDNNIDFVEQNTPIARQNFKLLEDFKLRVALEEEEEKQNGNKYDFN